MVIFISTAMKQKTIKNKLILQLLTNKKKIPLVFICFLFVAFFFMLTQEPACETMEDRFIWLSMFVSFIILGFVLSNRYDK